MTVAFKIISGYYHNLTYSSGEVVTFSFKMLKESDIKFIISMQEMTEEELNLRRYLIESKNSFTATYSSNSKIDGYPIFIVDIRSEVRDAIINELLS